MGLGGEVELHRASAGEVIDHRLHGARLRIHRDDGRSGIARVVQDGGDGVEREALQSLVERRPHSEAAELNLLPAELLGELLRRPTEEGRLVELGVEVAGPQLQLPPGRLAQLRGADVSVLPHRAQDVVPPGERGVRVSDRVVDRRRLWQAGEERRLRERQPRSGLREVRPRRRLRAVRVPAVEDLVDVVREDLLPRVRLEELRGEACLLDLARQRLLRVADVNKVDIIGERPQKIFIEFSHAKLATLGVTPQQIFDSVARQNAVVSGGSVDTSADRINVRVTGAFIGVAAIAAVPVQANGQIFRLGDVASVRRGYEDPPTFLVRVDGKPALGLGVSMQDGANIITLGENLKRAMAAITAELPVGIEITQIADQPHIVDESVSEFVKTFAEALVIVLVVSFLSLGWRTGIVVALSVPLVWRS